MRLRRSVAPKATALREAILRVDLEALAAVARRASATAVRIEPWEDTRPLCLGRWSAARPRSARRPLCCAGCTGERSRRRARPGEAEGAVCRRPRRRRLGARVQSARPGRKSAAAPRAPWVPVGNPDRRQDDQGRGGAARAPRRAGGRRRQANVFHRWRQHALGPTMPDPQVPNGVALFARRAGSWGRVLA